jgi:hypothetical protein
LGRPDYFQNCTVPWGIIITLLIQMISVKQLIPCLRGILGIKNAHGVKELPSAFQKTDDHMNGI